jgi:glycosyltransferase involved in cell wall biosynthesis
MGLERKPYSFRAFLFYTNMKLTCICPVWGRPQRTIRAIESVLAQEFEGAEILFIGDACSEFQKRLDDGTFKKYEELAAAKGNVMYFENLAKHGGGWGYMARKRGIELAKGEYVCFLDNDDVLKPNHFDSYYSHMKLHPTYDVGYFNSYVLPWKQDRQTSLSRSSIGHSELIIKTDVLKRNYQLDDKYEHDWRLIERMIKNKCKFIKSKNVSTYIVMSIPSSREKGIN